MESSINPWASTDQSVDIERLHTEFGIERIETAVSDLPDLPYFMKRGIVFGHRDYGQIVKAIVNHDPFHILTGFMPSGHPHLGHLMVMKEVVWHVEQGGNGYICVADREAHAVRNLSWEQCKKFGDEYLSCLFALGYEGETYQQSQNRVVQDLAFEASTKVNFSEMSAIYGFTPETDIGHAMSVLTQVSDILYPQVDDEPAPTVVPAGLDQDPHVRLTRGIAHKLRMFTVEDRDTHISIRSKEAPKEAMDAVQKAFKGSKRYEGHIDVTGVPHDIVAKTIRAIERANGGYGFVTPSATYHRFMPGLTGGKMSSSVPESIIGFYEDDKVVNKKIMSALTGGRMTLQEQKELGGEADKCPIYLLNLFHMVSDDTELAEIHRRCKAGELMCGQCKKDTAARVLAFLSDFREKMAVASGALASRSC
ncbi:MAG TPA: tryptophan--tRNA ligase [Methanospirillum sp.]|uniref:tryptophan--tRNA ligase n=1 Tax=Methanospirillum sp. TaxID=45200 RepID=UPI002B721AE4|nr:tryptophan--tRNA ligase [Methanospirillum sp.]HWQ63785.1 tryptophan--tRNA ligase [Methanospirillum sp.]